MEVGEQRYDFADIQALYESDRYPLKRDSDPDGAGPLAEGKAG